MSARSRCRLTYCAVFTPISVKRFRRRAAVETAWELRRHPERTRLPLLAFYCLPREAEIVDGLVELLIQVTHRITVKAGSASSRNCSLSGSSSRQDRHPLQRRTRRAR